jgi:radical SAM protein with 4Fe4S-binding SPASM domain
MTIRPFTLHLRMTKQCNADCSYCSSYETNSSGRMSGLDFQSAIRFIFDTALPALGAAPTHLSAQYIGGEILTFPTAELAQCVEHLRCVAKERGVSLRDGCQSNLIGSPERVDKLYQLFEGRLGTSVDSFSDSRTVKGSADRYRLLWRESDKFLRERRSPSGAVYVLDRTGVDKAEQQVNEAVRENRMITLRPVFQGGTPGQQLLGPSETRTALTKVFSRWFMRMPIIVEPFFTMTSKRLASRAGKSGGCQSACAFQADCTRKSLSLEPNGDLYICQEMADAGMHRIGNALTGEWDHQLVKALSERESHLSSDCQSCPYLDACQGGCMFESIQQGKGIFGKSYHCESWKALYAQIDEGIDRFGQVEVAGWLARIESRQQASVSDGLAMQRIEALEACASA